MSDSAYLIISSQMTRRFFMIEGTHDGMLWNIGKKSVGSPEQTIRHDLRYRFRKNTNRAIDRIRCAGTYLLSDKTSRVFACQTFVPESFTLRPRSPRIKSAGFYTATEIHNAYKDGRIHWGQLRMILEWDHSWHQMGKLLIDAPLKNDFKGTALGFNDWKRPT